MRAADNDEGIHRSGHRYEVRLAMLGGFAYRVQYLGIRETVHHGLCDAVVTRRELGGLRDEADMLQGGEAVDVFHGTDHESAAFRKAKEPGDLRVPRVAEDDNMASPAGVLANQALNLGHVGTGGVHKPDRQFRQHVSSRRGDAVCTDQERVIAKGVWIFAFNHSFAPELPHHLFVVNERAIGIYGVCRRLGHKGACLCHGAADAPAESRGIRDRNFHACSVSLSGRLDKCRRSPARGAHGAQFIP